MSFVAKAKEFIASEDFSIDILDGQIESLSHKLKESTTMSETDREDLRSAIKLLNNHGSKSQGKAKNKEPVVETGQSKEFEWDCSELGDEVRGSKTSLSELLLEGFVSRGMPVQ